jgi:ribosomal protein L29
LSFTEHDKRLLHNRLSDTIGPEEADILMEHLPPAGWSHLATKDDITLSGAVLRTEVAELRTELKSEIATVRTELKTEIAAVRTELKTEIAAVRTELKSEIATVRTDMAGLRVEMERGFRSQTWKMVTAMIASQGISVAIMAAMVNSLR